MYKTDNYIIINDFLSKNLIDKILKSSSNKKENDSKVGSNVNKTKKIRKDIFFSVSESKLLDNDIFLKVKNIVNDNFNIQLDYRETYKIGTYNSDEKGFYIPHTDTQGGLEHRQISIVICLTSKDDYEGGIFKFIDLKKEFKFSVGDAIIFKSNLLHGVEPITSGKRQVLISFMWSKSGELLRKNNNSSVNNSKYIPLNQIKDNLCHPN
jgi:predicted 2-oxoglutarate/Fe(II)-dependent dioxygenase YbiX